LGRRFSVQAVRKSAWEPLKEQKEEDVLKRVIYLATAALVAMLILVPAAMAQDQTMMVEETMMRETTQPLPASGGMGLSSTSVLLPAAALLLGSGVLGYAVLRRR
jgi:hypothetical protein